MDLLKLHIESYLNDFIGVKEFDFFLYDNIEDHVKKKKYIKLLKYINNLIDFKSEDIINSLHIHFENEFDSELEIIIFQMITAKCFYYHKSFEEKNFTKEFINNDLEDLIYKLQLNYNKLDGRCPEGASARNGGNRLYKDWVLQKSKLRCLLRFYESLHPNSTFLYKTLINCKVGFKNRVLENFSLNPLAVDIDNSDYKCCYNLINSNLTLNKIDEKSDFLDYITNIILFDCESKRVMTNYSIEELSKWNADYGTNFKNCIIITFGNGTNSIKKTKDKIQTIRERFKIKEGNSYTFLISELNFLLKRRTNKPSLDFIGFESSSFWDEFILETKISGLYELRSIRLMNIYSICYTYELKNFIIEDLFSKKESTELISSSTKMAILELSDEDIEKLREALSKTLDIIISSDIKSTIVDYLSNMPTIILDEAIIKNTKLLSMFTNCFELGKFFKIKSWSDLLNSGSNYFLILSYRDQGRHPNYYYPNLLEIELDSVNNVTAILPNFLFGNHYRWSKYFLLKEYYKLLTHPVRESHFEWNKLKNSIRLLKPEQKLIIDWNLENEYSNSEQRESYKIKVKGQKVKTVYGSDLFIISDDKYSFYKVVRTDFLMNFENDDGKVYIQNLDGIQENINIYEKIVDKKQEEEELEIIRKQFNLGDETAGRLWKLLLKNIAEEKGEDKFYSELKIYFENKGLKMVSQFHFKNSWVNPQSESVAPLSKRVFIELCEYLKIPKIYYVIIQRIRNASKQSSRQSTRQMNQLLKDLFNDGCFDNNQNSREIIVNRLNYYKVNHPLDELGIGENYLADNLVALVELILPELKLVELETIEKTSNE